MSVAQRIQLGPFFASGQLLGGAKLYHYAAGTTMEKDIWQDRAKTVTLPQPLVGDANGLAWAYFEGLYKLVITDASGIVLYQWDPWGYPP